MEKALKVMECGFIKVFGEETLDGGGTTFGLDFLPIVKERFGKVTRVFEFCCGFGFIGFSLLGNGLCDSLCLADINPKPIELARRTVRENNIEDKVSIYLSDCFDNIPESERWDLGSWQSSSFFLETIMTINQT